MKIGLLECDNVVGRFSTVEGGYREMFAALLEPHVPQLRFSYYEAWKGELPAAADACEAWLCTGSQYSVYDRFDWIGALSQFLRELQKQRQPYVGICFGHQMLAQALGGEVLREEPWMEPPQPRFAIHHMHADQVRRLPADAVVLGRSDHCEIGMFRVGESMLGIEGHPEFTIPYSEALIRARNEKIGAARAQRALASLAQRTDERVVGKWIAGFIRSARRGSRSA